MTDVDTAGTPPTTVSEAAAEATVDPPPLWRPHDEQEFRNAALASPPSAVDGWTWPGRLRHFFFSSPRAVLTRVGMLVALVILVSALPGWADDSSWGNLWRVAWYHTWTLTILAIVSTRVRTFPAHRLVAFVILGASAAAMAVDLVTEPIVNLTGSGTPVVWVTPPLEEAVKLLLVAGVLIGARRRLSQPGIVDLAVLGYAVGAGFAFHEDALWGRVTTSGFESPWGLLFPSIFQPDGFFAVGHAVWTSLAAIGLGLIVLHWRRPLWAVAGVVMIVVPVVDHMAVNSRDDSFDWVVDVLFDHKLPAMLLVIGLVVAFVLDIRVRRALGARDHLLPEGRGHHPGDDPDPDRSVTRAYAARRYRRFRNGVYYARHRDRVVWPASRPPATSPTLVALGRSARAAGYPVGPRADMGWDLDPTDPDRARWFTPDGWSPYVATTTGVGLDPAPGRPHVIGLTRHDPPANWAALLGLFAAIVAAAVVIRLLTVPDKGPGGIQFSPPPPGGGGPVPDNGETIVASLADAPIRPPRRMFGAAAGAGAGGYGGPGPADGPGQPGGPEGAGGPGSPWGPPGPTDAPPDDPPPDEDCE